MDTFKKVLFHGFIVLCAIGTIILIHRGALILDEYQNIGMCTDKSLLQYTMGCLLLGVGSITLLVFIGLLLFGVYIFFHSVINYFRQLCTKKIKPEETNTNINNDDNMQELEAV